MDDILKLSAEEFAGLNFKCSCGRSHEVKIKKIRIGSGVVSEIPDIISEFKGSKVFFIADRNTYEAAGRKVEEVLKGDFIIKRLIFPDKMFVADEKTVGRLFIEVEDDTALIVTVGSGTLNDISRFLSYKMHIPFVIVCTAPSMDGYASVVSPLIVDGIKTTYPCVYPYAIIADIEVMKNAPLHMLRAGFGDVMGKYTALCDWRMANILKDEYYCETTAQLVRGAIEKCLKVAPVLSVRDEEAVRSVTEALILSGIAMGFVGNSRPASGGEHQISHFWEMRFLLEGKNEQWLHGNKVGVATGMLIEIYNYLNEIDIDYIYRSGKYRYFDKTRWIKNITDGYGEGAAGVISFKERFLVVNEGEREKNAVKIKNRWEKLKKWCFSGVPDARKFKEVMACAGAVYYPQEMGIDRELFKKTLVVSKEIRNRYGVLQLLEDLGILEEVAERIAAVYYG